MLRRGAPDYLPGIRQRLYTAVLSDVLDELGHRDQAMTPSIRPLDDALVLAGFARTGLCREVHHVDPADNPYLLEIALIDDLAQHDVAVFGCGGSTRIAPWGELLTTASRARGAAGCARHGVPQAGGSPPAVAESSCRRTRRPRLPLGISTCLLRPRPPVSAVAVPFPASRTTRS